MRTPTTLPPTRPGPSLRRGRLLDALDGADATGLALVIAPVGSGKTTILQQWAATRPGRVHWLDPSELDDDRVLDVSLAGATVVLDEVQRLGQRHVSALSRQIEQNVPGTTFVIAGRSLPQFNLAHCEFPDPVLITERDLQFRPQEIADLFRQVYGAPITDALSRELARTTQGWAAALYLQHLSERSTAKGRARAASRRPRASLLVDQTYTGTYLAHEVLDPLPPSLVHFLQVTCVLDPLSVGDCDLLLSWDRSKAALRELSECSGLVRRDSERPDVFHCHPVLRAHLRARLDEAVGALRGRELVARAANIRRDKANASGPGTDRLEVNCLGGFRFRTRGVEVDLSQVRPSARTVLRILAVHAGEPVHREALVEFLWADRTVEAGIHNLHVAVSSLRRCLDGAVGGRGRELLARCGDAYVLAPGDDLATDIQRLERALLVATRACADGDAMRHGVALRLAVELYAGDVLPEDGPAEWVVEVRAHLRQRVAHAAAELARLELDRGHLSVAVASARRSIELDPWNDASWRRLIEAHRRGGDHAQAAVARRAYHGRLLDLGVETGEAPGAAAPRLRTS